MPDIIKKARANLASNFSKKENYKNIGYGFIGALLQPIIPSIIQGIGGADEKGLPKWDMSGWKGILAGIGVSTLTGYALNKPAIAYGSMSVAAAHIFWVKGQDTVMELTKFPIPPFDRNAVVMADDLPEGFKPITLPNGKTIIAEVKAGEAQPQQLSEYIDPPQTQLSEFFNPQAQLSEFFNPQAQLSEFFEPQAQLSESNYPTMIEQDNLSDYEAMVDAGIATN